MGNGPFNGPRWAALMHWRRREAAMTATPTTATMMLHTAFISGFTPRRTSE
jgi:hypothetical protein